jgi:hypothetical protein
MQAHCLLFLLKLKTSEKVIGVAAIPTDLLDRELK